ncbi:MAG: glycosyltransferase family 39 protein, partial [Anaerolineales bacterium]
STLLLRGTLTALFLLGLAVRTLDLTEPPLDYQPTRQLHGALIARAHYYQWLPSADPKRVAMALDTAKGEGRYEPPILESLVAFTYLLTGGEQLWLARIWSMIFWLVGGGFVYGLARRIASADGAVIAVAYFLFLPLGVTVSRSFQPDSLMVMLLAGSAYALLLWNEKRNWRWAMISGLACGLTVLVKGRPAPIVAAMLAGLVLGQGQWRRSLLNPQLLGLAAAAIVPPAIYYLGVAGAGTLSQVGEFSTGVSGLLTDRSFYGSWLVFVDELVSFGAVLLGFLGIALLPRTGRGLLAGMWVGYLLYGLALPYNITTHDYYNLPLVPIVAVLLAPIGSVVLGRMANLGSTWRAFVVAILAFAVAYQAWLARSAILATDYHSEPLGWIKMGRELPATGSIIGLTHDYGARIAYYGWRPVASWPTTQDFALFDLQGHGRSADFDAEFE